LRNAGTRIGLQKESLTSSPTVTLGIPTSTVRELSNRRATALRLPGNRVA
jgi:hypothetical protein